VSRIAKVISGLIIAAGLSSSAWAGEISLAQSLDRSDIPYEERANLEIVVTWHGNQAAYRFDRPLQPQLDKLRVKEFSSSISSEGTGADEISTKRFRYSLTPTASGTARVEPMVIKYISWPDSLPGELVTEAMTITVASAKPAAKPFTLKQHKTTIFATAGGLVLVGGLGVGLMVRSRRRRPKPVEKSVSEQFLERLPQLRQEANGDLKKFQTGLYKNLLWFLSAEYGLTFANEPVEQILRQLDHAGIPDRIKDRICGWLLQADRVKFSPMEPLPGEAIRLESEVRQFFETITPIHTVEDR
jgi:hypothetical protein